jgi:hypothetical protein
LRHERGDSSATCEKHGPCHWLRRVK